MSHRIGTRLARAAAGSVALAVAPQLARAQTTEIEEVEPAESSALSLAVGLDFTTAYFFRGYLQEDHGSILQPAAELGIELLEGDTTSLSLVLGTWNSYHSRSTGATTPDSFVGGWFESDLYAGLGLEVGDWSFGTQLVTYSYPGGAASSIDEMVLSVAFDDSALWGGDFALRPHVLYALETDDRGGPEDSYAEVGIAYSRSIELGAESELSLEVPLTVGLGADDYYVTSAGSEDTIGFWDIGLNASYGLPVSKRFGGWSLTAGVHYLGLGDAAEEANQGDGSAVVGTIGLSLGY